MLPFDHKSWAKHVAASIIAVSVAGAVGLVVYFRQIGMLHISEIVGIFLLLLTIIPPNLAIITHKCAPGETPGAAGSLGHIR